MIIIIIIIPIFNEDNVFSMSVNLPYGPPMNTDNDYTLFVSDAMLVLRRESSGCPIMLSTKQGSRWYHV